MKIETVYEPDREAWAAANLWKSHTGQEVFFIPGKDGYLKQAKISPKVTTMLYGGTVEKVSPHTGNKQIFLRFLVRDNNKNNNKFVFFPQLLWDSVKNRWYQPNLQ